MIANRMLETNRRPIGQSDGSGEFEFDRCNDRSFSAAVDELGR